MLAFNDFPLSASDDLIVFSDDCFINEKFRIRFDDFDAFV